MRKILIILPLTIIFISCSSNKVSNNEEITSSSPEKLYIEAMSYFDNSDLDNATIIFNKIEKKYPLSNEAVQSQINLAFIDYLNLEYGNAIFKFNRIILKYPSHKNIDYVYYMRAICYFEQISNEQLDSDNNYEALNNFNQVITRFPDSDYAKDSKAKIILVKENIAAKHMDIGRFYMENNNTMAAMNRFKKIIENYSTSKFTPEALYRLVEIYYKLGMKEDAMKTASVISYNYPNSKWYKYSYNLLVDDEDDSFINKIKKILKKNEDSEKS